MRIVELYVTTGDFGNVLGAMRDWLDRNDGDPVKFESESHTDGLIRIRMEFSRADLAQAFRRDFAGVGELTKAA
jgi:hypothetical protein